MNNVNNRSNSVTLVRRSRKLLSSPLVLSFSSKLAFPELAEDM